ncbi:NAD(P)H-hydrate epimerase / ADP-dependent (S)-NAD(P)H-hydrate dehydratase [hydrothermal vent metagenome]|uniref:Nicotinamide nucleotide repair protein n=1 Tax=hydrothermal vent metagenome TaxID=652676 RepID=A0A3B1A6I0_9ZZZZ
MDQYAIDHLAISGTVLMERAGAAAFELIQMRWPEAKSVVVVCGTGNNGGDGFVVARLAKENGLAVKCMQVGDKANLKGDALAAAQRLDLEAIPFNAEDCKSADLLVDAVLGTGLEGNVTGERFDVIMKMNESAKPVLSLDVPSGLNADSGHVQGIAIKAAATITFIGNKQGLFIGDGWDYSGERIFNPLSVPLSLYDETQCDVELINYRKLKSILKPRAANSHKGDYGHVLVVGGEAGYTGAARMAGEAAARVGAGLVSIATRPEHACSINGSRPELMVHGVDDKATFEGLAEKATVIAIGPGLGQSDWAKNLMKYAINSGLPLVVDADALNLLSAEPQKNDNWVLTPHAGEAARLLGKSVREVQSDRFATVKALHDEFAGTVVLKGTGTLISAGEMPLFLCIDGNPGMSSGGMGDVLTGIIAGLLAQGLDKLDAASLGVCLHAAAGDLAAKTGQRGLLASDLMGSVRRLANP